MCESVNVCKNMQSGQKAYYALALFRNLIHDFEIANL